MGESVSILGISCFYHDSAACLVKDGQIIAAAQEERFTRKKHDEEFPKNAVDYCLKEGGVGWDDLDFICFYDKPFLKFERLAETYLAYAPSGIRSFLKAMPVWLKEKLWMREIIKRNTPEFKGKLLFTRHHESHAASAFFPSPFNTAAILTLDGVGEWTTTSIGIGENNKIQLVSEIRFPHSLGLLYAALTYYLGFKINSGEYKVMGLAPYGQPVYKNLFYDHLVSVKDDGSFRLNMKYFNYCAGLTMTNSRFHGLFGGPPRRPETPLSQRHMDIAASLQAVSEEIILRIAEYVKRLTGKKYLCLAGGVALNCVANGKLLKQRTFDDLWIQPAAGDAGGALGAALFVWHQYLGQERRAVLGRDGMQGSFLGPSYSNREIKNFLDSRGLSYKIFQTVDELVEATANLLSQGEVVGWFQGRMEFGPRALGARSILGDARLSEMQSVMNLKIKFRESFRPFAPVVLEEKVAEYFDIDRPSPYMLLVADVVPAKRVKEVNDNGLFGIDKLKVARSVIPAVTHVDYSARVQTINPEHNKIYYDLVRRFYEKTGCPVLVNTSFNVRGEPIVQSPGEAYACFMRTGIDFLVLGDFLLDKKEQPVWREERDWRAEFELD